MVAVLISLLFWGITKEIRDRYSSEIFRRLQELSLYGLGLSLLSAILGVFHSSATQTFESAGIALLFVGTFHFWGMPWKSFYRYLVPVAAVGIAVLSLLTHRVIAGLLILIYLGYFLFMLLQQNKFGKKGIPFIALGVFLGALILDVIYPSYIFRSWEGIAVTYALIERLIIYLHSIYQTSVTDRLTGLVNRATFLNYVEDFVKTDYWIGVIFVDIDNFKSINDTHGHDRGDSVLKEVSKILKDAVAGIGVAGRFGGEEMVALVVDQDALAFAETLRKNIMERTEVTASIGVAISKGQVNANDLVTLADQAMYIAKKSGKNKVILGTEELLK